MKQLLNQFKRHNQLIIILSAILIALGYMFAKHSTYSFISTISFSIVAILCGIPILIRAIAGLRYKTVGIEVLVSIAVIGALLIQEYSEAGMVTFLFQLGSFLEQFTLQKTRNAIHALTKLAPANAIKKINDQFVEVAIEEVVVDDQLLVKAGSYVAVDGIITKGNGYFNEASITGESKLAHKHENELVYASTLLDAGTIEMRASCVGEDTTFAKIIALVEEAQDAKSPIERFIDRFAKYYTPFVAVMAIGVALYTQNISLAITILVLACPGALVIGAPVANVAGIGKGAKEGILLKGGDSIHTFAKTDVVVFDKTGTLTQGKPGVSQVINYHYDPNFVLELVASIEKSSDHPLASAILNYVHQQGLIVKETLHSETIKGMGLVANFQEKTIVIGNQKLMEQQKISLSNQQIQDLYDLQTKGMTTILVGIDLELVMMIGVSDQIREEAYTLIEKLKQLGIKKTIMLTGDNLQTAQSVANQLHIDEVRADLLPEAKLAEVKRLQALGHNVTFVGDGINDSPALAIANTGIAMGSGTDVAIETSDVVLMKSDLNYLVRALALSKQTLHLTNQNIAIALGTVVLLLIGLMFDWIHMASGMFIHELSILVVILNAMRILFIKRKGAIQ